MAVRPGNLFVPGCYALAAAMVLLWSGGRRRWAQIALTGIVTAAVLAAPLVPQVLINQRNYHITSALPMLDLSKLQTSFGLEMLRYSTNVSTTCGDAGLVFLNPDRPDLEMSTVEALRYYGLHWPAGPRAAGLHLFSGLDPRPFLVDQHDFGTGYERWLQGLSVVLLILAAFGIVPAWRRLRRLGLRSQPHVLFLAAVVVFATGILATSAAEYRFGSIPLVVVSLLAALGLSQMLRPRCALAASLTFAVAMPAWIAVSNYVLSTSDIWRQCS